MVPGIGYPSPCKRHDHPEIACMGLAVCRHPMMAGQERKDELWQNYEYFIKAVIPYAEKHNIKLALHPDDPPLPELGDVERIMISYENIKKAVCDIVKSDNLGVTMCQASYKMMGEDLYKIIPDIAEKIFFVHFRNARGNRYKFHETFHDNGEIDMADILRFYERNYGIFGR